MPDFYPDIEEYLESTTNKKSVSSKGLDELVYRVRAATGLDYDVAQQIVRLYFQEIRNAMLRGDVVALKGLGKFFISSPLHGNKEQIFPKFEPYKALSDRLNDE
jgi:hypothetical protein